MWIIWSVFISTFLLDNLCEAIKCADVEFVKFNKKPVRNTTCEGDLCMNFSYKRFKQVDKTCIKTEVFTIPKGCTQFDRFSPEPVVCFCDTDFCNAGNITATPETVLLKEYNCVSTFESAPVAHSLAPTCSMTVVDKDGKRTISKYAETEYTSVFPVHVAGTAQLESFSYLFGVVHTISGIQKNVTKHYYRCQGDECNEKDHGKLKAKDDVTCTTTAGDHCKGEFCVFATNGTSFKYCLSTEVITGSAHYEVGVFRYKKATFYLCKENNCNSDEETAMLSADATREELADKDTENKKKTTTTTKAKTTTTTTASSFPQNATGAAVLEEETSGEGSYYTSIFSVVAMIYFHGP